MECIGIDFHPMGCFSKSEMAKFLKKIFSVTDKDGGKEKIRRKSKLQSELEDPNSQTNCPKEFAFSSDQDGIKLKTLWSEYLLAVGDEEKKLGFERVVVQLLDMYASLLMNGREFAKIVKDEEDAATLTRRRGFSVDYSLQAPVSTADTDGHPSEFIFGVINQFFTLVDNESVPLAHLLKPELSDKSLDYIHSRRSLLVSSLTALSILGIWPHNTNVIWNKTPDFPNFLVKCLSANCDMIGSLTNRLTNGSGFALDSNEADTMVFSLTSLLNGIQFISRSMIHRPATTVRCDLDESLRGEFLPQQPWNPIILKKLGGRTYNHYWSDSIFAHVSFSALSLDSYLKEPGSGRENLHLESPRNNVWTAELSLANACEVMMATAQNCEDLLMVLLSRSREEEEGVQCCFVTTLVLQVEALHALSSMLHDGNESVNFLRSGVQRICHQLLSGQLDGRFEMAMLKKIPVRNLMLTKGLLLLKSLQLCNPENLQSDTGEIISKEVPWTQFMFWINRLFCMKPDCQSVWLQETIRSQLSSMVISVDFVQEFKFSMFSIDFWPWRTLSSDGCAREPVCGDLMEEIVPENYNAKKYRMCVAPDDDEIDARNLHNQDNLAEEVRHKLIGCFPGSGALEAVFSLFLKTMFERSTEGISRRFPEKLQEVKSHCWLYLKNLQEETSSDCFAFPLCQLLFVKFLSVCLCLAPNETIQACRTSAVWTLLFGPLFLTGGDKEISILFEQDCFVHLKIPRRGRNPVRYWSINAGSSDLTVWNSLCCFGWLVLRDSIFDFTAEVVRHCFSSRSLSEIAPFDDEVMTIMKVLRAASVPSTASLSLVYQCVRWLRHVLHPSFGELPQSDKVRIGCNCMVECVDIISLHLELIGINRQSHVVNNTFSRDLLKFLWPARAAVIEFILNFSALGISPTNMDMISIFLEKRRSASSITEFDGKSMEFTDSLGGKSRLKTLETLILDPRSRAAAVKFLSEMVFSYTEEYATLYSHSPLQASYRLPTHVSTEKSKESIEQSKSYLLTFKFDLIERFVYIVTFTLSCPQSVDSYECALSCLRALAWMLSCKRYQRIRYPLQELFRGSEAIAGILHALLAMQKPNDVKETVLSSDQCGILQTILRQGISLITCIMVDNESNRLEFSRMVLGGQKYTNFQGENASLVEDGEIRRRRLRLLSYDNITALFLHFEPTVSLETVLLFFDMLLEVSSLRSRSALTAFVVPEKGMFHGGHDRPKIRNRGAIPCLFSIIPHCELPIRAFILQTFSNLVKGRASLVNLASCAQSTPPVLDLALDLFSVTEDSTHIYIVNLMKLLGKHSISVGQLKHLFHCMQGDGRYRPAHNFRIVQALKGMISEDSGPRHTFVFEGEKSGLQIPPIQQWPVTKFSFCTWIQVETPNRSVDGCQNSGSVDFEDIEYCPYIFCLRDPTGAGFELFLRRNRRTGSFRLLLSSCSDLRECSTLELGDVWEGQWHFVAFSVRSSTYLAKSEAILMVDGNYASSQTLQFPYFNEPIMHPTLGACPHYVAASSMKTTMRGQLGAVYIFSDYLPVSRLNGIRDLGPNYHYCFEPYTIEYKEVACCQIQLEDTNFVGLLDGTLSSQILLAYSPAVWSGDEFLDNTPIRNNVIWSANQISEYLNERGIFVDKKGNYKMHSLRLPGTYRSSAQDIRKALDSLGGVKTVLPLFAQVDQPRRTNTGDFVPGEDVELSFAAIDFLGNLLGDSRRDVRAFGLLGYLLERVSPRHLSLTFLAKLVEIFDFLSWNSQMQDNMFESLLCNFKLWRYSDFIVQTKLFHWLMEFVSTCPEKFCEILNVQKLLQSISLYFESEDYSDTLDDSPRLVTVPGRLTVDDPLTPSAKRTASKLSFQEQSELRGKILEIVVLLFVKEPSKVSGFTESLVHFILSTDSAVGKTEGLRILLKLLHLQGEKSALTLGILAGLGSFGLIQPLAACHSVLDSKVRLYTLLLFARIIYLADLIPASSLSFQKSPFKAESISPMESREQAPPSLDIQFADDMNSSFAPGNVKEAETESVFKPNDRNSLAALDMSVSILTGILMAIKSMLLEAMHCQNETSAKCVNECEAIIAILQMLMFGNVSFVDGIVEAIERLDVDSPNHVESNVSTAKVSTDESLNCCYIRRDTRSGRNSMLSLQLSSDTRICVPMVFGALLEFVSDELVSAGLRCSTVVNLRAVIACSDTNCDMILRIPCWQDYVLKLILAENIRVKELREAFVIHETNISIAKKLISKSEAIVDACIRMLCDLQVAAVRIGRPMGPLLVASKNDPIQDLSLMCSLKEISRGERHLGVAVLRETMSCLRVYGERGDLNVQEVGFTLLMETISAMQNERNHSDQKKESTKWTNEDLIRSYIEKIGHLHFWLVASIVLEFVTVPIIQRAVNSVCNELTGIGLDVTETVTLQRYLGSISDVRKSTRSMTWQLVDSLLNLIGNFDTITPAWMLEERVFRLQVSAQIGVIAGSRMMAKVNEGVDSIVQPILGTGSLSKSSKDSATTKQLNAVTSTKSPIALMKKTPLSHATGGVCWIMLRVLCSFLTCDDLFSSQPLNAEVDSSKILDRLKSLVRSCEGKSVDFCTFESLNIVSKLSQALSCLDMTDCNVAATRSAFEFMVELVITNRESLYEIINSCLQDAKSSEPGNRRSLSRVSRSSITFNEIPFGIEKSESMVTKNATTDDFLALDPSIDNSSGAILSVWDSFCVHFLDPSSGSDQALALIGTIERSLNMALNLATRDSELILPWEVWCDTIAAINRKAQSMEAELLSSRMTEMGLHRHSEEVKRQLANLRVSENRISQEWRLKASTSSSFLRSSYLLALSNFVKSEDNSRRRNDSKWSTVVSDLANERGPWGYGGKKESFAFWMLDQIETDQRKRPVLRRNVDGTHHHIASRIAQRTSNLTVPVSNEPNTDDVMEETDGMWKDLMKYRTKRKINQAESSDPSLNDDDHDEGSDVDEEESFGAKATVTSWESLTSADPDFVLFSEKCEIITIATNASGIRNLGTLELTRSKISFVRSSDERERPTTSSSNGNVEISWICRAFPNTAWQTSEVHGLYQRHYLLQFTAIEFFLTSRSSVFINLYSVATAKRFYKTLKLRVRPPLLWTPAHRMPIKAMPTVTYGNGANAMSIVQAWMQRKISNFDYLMILNTIAGRTNNDLGQYPVFPWVIADYSSSKLDLRDRRSFRDLRWPMGAQTEQQRSFCVQRYRDADEMYSVNPAEEFPPFHHGTHYSCMGFVFWYLIRMEPYTSLHVWLQDGKFDHADRLFHSIPTTFKSSTTNHNDVKELIPEFFYCPEFLENVNEIDLGTLQSGARLGNVVLPAWCDNAFDFVRINRDALESEYVSQYLHNWIDLIFGYKQRPPMFKGTEAAVESCNVFFHLTYAGAVDLEDIARNDEMLYKRTIRQIDNYGQTPSQLFDKPHPARLPMSKVRLIWPIASVLTGVDTILRNENEVMPDMPKKVTCFKEEHVSVSPILFLEEVKSLRKLVTVDASRVLGFHGFQVRQPDVVPPFVFKPDTNAIKAAEGQLVSDWISRSFSSIKVNQREYVVGVPLAPFGVMPKCAEVASERSNGWINLIGMEENRKQVLRKETERTKLKEKSRDRSSGSTPIDSRKTTSANVSSSPPSSSSLSARPNQSLGISSIRPKDDVGIGDPDTPRREGKEPKRDKRRSGSREGSSTTRTSSFHHAAGANSSEYLFGHLFSMLPDSKLLFSCGHWDCSFKVTAADTGRLVQSLAVHTETVTCLAAASDFNLHWVVTGSKDCTVMIWEVIPDRLSPVTNSPLHVLFGHDDGVTSLAVNPQLDVVASGSDDGSIIIHGLRTGVYIRTIELTTLPQDISTKLPPPPTMTSSPGSSRKNEIGGPVVSAISARQSVLMLCISTESFILAYSSDGNKQFLYSFGINGRFIEKIDPLERLYCMRLSLDGKVLLTGGERCLVVLRWVHSLLLANDGPRRGQYAVLDGMEDDQGPFLSPIRSLLLTQGESQLVVGLESGAIRVLAQDSEYLRKRLVSNLEDIGLITHLR